MARSTTFDVTFQDPACTKGAAAPPDWATRAMTKMAIINGSWTCGRGCASVDAAGLLVADGKAPMSGKTLNTLQACALA